jgi:hypothetical protein
MSSDDQPHSIRIGRAGRYVSITLREPQSGPTLAARLVRGNHSEPVLARIELEVDEFRASYTTDLIGANFPSFREALAQLYSFESREARFDSIEGELKIEIKGDGLGHFLANCVARKHTSEVFPCLTFNIEFDQTEIPKILAELDAALGLTR